MLIYLDVVKLEVDIGVEEGMMVWQVQLLKYARVPIKVVVDLLKKLKDHSFGLNWSPKWRL